MFFRAFPLLTTLFITSFFTIQIQADVSLPRIICDNMVLQQNSKNAIWGYAQVGEKVSVTSSWGETHTTQGNQEGKWKVMLPTPAYGTNHWIKIQGQNQIEVKNVAIGEVWLCAGQSNMGFALQTTYEVENDAPKANHPNLRIFKSNREHWHEPLERSRDRLATWSICTPEIARTTSAVSFYFAQKLHLELDIPVGIIQKAYAGTPIEGWMPWDIQKNDERTQAFKQDMDSKVKPGMYEAAFKKYADDVIQYQRDIDTGNIKLSPTSHRSIAPAFITKPAPLGHQYPGNIYNGMIHSIVPYGIKGMIWYQGERNSKTPSQAEHYQSQLAQLISYYRQIWHDGSNGAVSDSFPFQCTQLPSWHAPQQQPVEGTKAVWAINRESMRLASINTPNTYMAVSIDTGDPIDLHPYNKKSIGVRHAYLALKNTYQKDFVSTGPSLLSQKIEGQKIILSFEHIGSGLTTAKNVPIDSFAIAGEDRIWKWAKAQIKGHKIILENESIQKPVAVRYAWAMNPSQRNLIYNKEGLPASPFRTDSWPLYTDKDSESQIDKPKMPKPYLAQDWTRPEMKQ